MKSIKNWSIFLMTVMVLPLVMSCGNDNDNNDDKGKSSVLEKHLSTIEHYRGMDDRTIIYNLHYDTNGNLLNISRNTQSINSFSYNYMDNMVVMTPYSNDVIKYILMNNRLVSVEDKYNGLTLSYSYDNNNNLLSCLWASRSNQSFTFSYTWLNGNLTRMDYNGGTIDIDYTSHLWPRNYIMPFEYIDVYYDSFMVPGVFMAMGLCGNHPNNLPKRIGDKEYNYILNDGYPINIKVGNDEFKYTWN